MCLADAGVGLWPAASSRRCRKTPQWEVTKRSHRCYSGDLWSVEGTNEFAAWYDTLTEEQQDAPTARVEMLEQYGPTLKRPIVGAILSSRYAPLMKELRVSKEGQLRVLCVFDPRRTAILLLGGNKTGRWQE